MNTRTVVLTLALAALNVAALAVSGSAPAPEVFAPGHLLVVSAADGLLVDAGAVGGGFPVAVTGLSAPGDMTFAPDGALLVCDGGSDSVLVFDGTGALQDSIGAGSGLSGPTGLAFGADGRLFVASAGSNSVFEFDRDGGVLGDFGSDAGLDSPWGVALGPDGRIHVASSATDSVFVFDASGAFLREIGGGSSLLDPRGVCFAADGHLFVSSAGNDRVVEFDASGDEVGTIGEASALSGPVGLCFGRDGLLYVASGDGGGVMAFARDGTFKGSHAAPNGPSGLAFVPYVFDASLKGVLQRPDDKPEQVKSAAWVSVSPGSQTVMVRLLDDTLPLAGDFASDTWVLHGFGVAESPAAKVLSWAGEQASADAAGGLASLLLKLRDTVGAGDGPGGGAFGTALFGVKKFDGDFQRAGPAGVASGTIKSVKLLQP